MSATVYRRLRTKRDAAQAEMFARPAPKPSHQHRAKSTDTRPYFGPVSASENPAAHGGVCLIKTCACGATQHVNCNGLHREHGPWTRS